jgi:hypothetical protein
LVCGAPRFRQLSFSKYFSKITIDTRIPEPVKHQGIYYTAVSQPFKELEGWSGVRVESATRHNP